MNPDSQRAREALSMTGLIMPSASLRQRSNPFSMQSYRREGWTESKRNGMMEKNKRGEANV